MASRGTGTGVRERKTGTDTASVLWPGGVVGLVRLDGAFFREVRVLEGAQSGKAGVEAVGREEIRRLLEEEALLCEGRGGSDIAERLRAEAEKIR